MFTDLDAGDGGGDRGKLATIFGWCLWFEIESVLMSRSTAKEDEDA
jgi:hypothetical protein